MACCGRAPKASSVPLTSGDLEALGAGLPDRFAVVSKTETDPETGQALVLSAHPDYRLADLARQQTGGRIRVIRK